MKNLSVSMCLALALCSPLVMAKTEFPISAQQQAETDKFFALIKSGNELNKAQDYIGAEIEFRAAIKLEPLNGWNVAAYPGLAEALGSQNKTSEAIEVYRLLLSPVNVTRNNCSGDPLFMMNFAALLNQTGQYDEAARIAGKALAGDSDSMFMLSQLRFDPKNPRQDQFQAAVFVLQGFRYGSDGENKSAMGEYEKAMRIAPDLEVAYYYYGLGRQKLSPAERKQYVTAQQAKTALKKR